MQIEAKVVNKFGLHARPAAEFVRCARTFKATIIIRKDNETFSATSILDVLSANLDCGSNMLLEATGPDEELALKRLQELLWNFKEEDDKG